MKRLTIILAVLTVIILLALSGCSQKEKESEYAVKVNGHEISMSLYHQKLNAVKTYWQKQGLDVNSQQGRQALDSIKQDILEDLITTEIIRQEIREKGWDLYDPAIEQLIDDLKQQIGSDFDEWLQEQAMTEEEVRSYLALTHYVGQDTTLTEQEVKQFFDRYYANYGGQEEQVKARHILLETEEQAREVINQLKAGADFAELAKEKSIEDVAEYTGGDLGYFSRGRMVPAFEEAAFSQKVGEISAHPVKSQFGYHVILVEDYKPGVKPAFEPVKEQVRKDALEYAKHQKVQTYYAVLRQQAKIEYAPEFQS